MLKKIFAFGLASFFALAAAQFAGAQYQSGQEPQSGSPSRPYWQDQGQTTRDRDMSNQEQSDQYRTGEAGQPGREPRQDQASGAGQEQSRPAQQQASRSHEKSKKPEAASMYLDVNKLIGAKVEDRNGKDTGSVSNLILDRSGKVVYVIVSQGGFAGLGGKNISVPVGAVTITGTGDKQLLAVNVDEEQLKAAPEYQSLANLSNRLYSETIYRFFGLQPQWSDQGQGTAVQSSHLEQSQQSGNQDQWQYQEQPRSQGQQPQEPTGR